MSSAADISIRVLALFVVSLCGTGVAAGGGVADTLAERVRLALAGRTAPGVETRIEVRGLPQGVDVPETAFDVRVAVPLRFRPKGAVRCDAEVVAGGKVIHRFLLTVVFHTMAEVLVAERLLDKHAVVGAADVGAQRIETTDCAEAPLTRSSELIGLRSKRIIPAGTILVPSMFEPVPLVRSGSEVTILVTTGAVRVRTRGVARGDGGKGDRVAVRPAGGHRELKGIVVGDETVEVAAE